MISRSAKRLLGMAVLVLIGCVAIGVVFYLVQLTPGTPPSPKPPYLVGTQYGQVQGFSDGQAQLFLGIPYAAAPTHNMRWKPPAPAAPWGPNPLSGMYPGPACPQGVWGPYNITRWDEDCLFLSVYTPLTASVSPLAASEPKTPTAAERTLLPVLVFLHGGGFAAGSGDQRMYNASKLANLTETVVVAVNYRLGAFGFLATPELAAEQGTAGNYGLLDQRAALAFVFRNIASFGGDPTQVTLMGQGTGAEAALLQVGLETADSSELPFSRLVVDSGPIWNGSLTTMAEAYNAARALSRLLNCSGASALELECLRGARRSDIVSASLHTSIRRLWRPAAGGHGLPSSDSALAALHNAGGRKPDGSYHLRSIVLGSAANDATARLYWALPATQRHNLTVTQAKEVIQEEFPCGNSAERIWAKYKGTFESAARRRSIELASGRQTTGTTGTVFKALAQVLTDGAYHCRNFELARTTSGGMVASTYAYRFGHHLSFVPAIFEASHFMMLPFIFGVPCFADCGFQSGVFTPSERVLEQQAASVFGASFRGRPLSLRIESGTAARHLESGATLVEWPLFTPATQQLLNLGAPAGVPAVSSFLSEGTCEFWSGIYAASTAGGGCQPGG